MITVLAAQLGPVQGFIAASRRGRDLWFSSWLLSDLARAAARAAAAAGARLVVPHEDAVGAGDGGHEEAVSLPNRLLAELPEGVDPPAVGREMEDACRSRLAALWEKVAGEVSRHLSPEEFFEAEARAQVEDLLEFHWAAAEAADFRTARARALRLLAATRSAMPFAQPSWAMAGVPKGTLDGLRESVIHEGLYEEARRGHGPALKRFQRLGVGRAERMDGPALLKRLGHRAAPGAPGSRLLSTAHLAAHPALEALAQLPEEAQGQAAEAFDEYLEALRSIDRHIDIGRVPRGRRHDVLGDVDAGVLYPARLADRLGTASDQRAAQRALDRLFVRWDQLWRAHAPAGERARQDRLPRPGAYYALLRADGDRMGRAIDALDEPAAQARFSAALERFAETARDTVRDHGGHCVYAGGDDVLALLPVERALACARTLADEFGRVLAEAAPPGAAPTLSAGIVIAHHLDPFGGVLRDSWEAEGAAKERYGRDAWALLLRKRSGAPVLVGGKWSEAGRMQDLVDSWSRAAGGGGLPRGLPGDLVAISTRTPLDRARLSALCRPGADGRAPAPDERAAWEEMVEVHRLELERVLAAKDIGKQDRDRILDTFDKHSERAAPGGDGPPGDPLRELADELAVARALTGLDASEVQP